MTVVNIDVLTARRQFNSSRFEERIADLIVENDRLAKEKQRSYDEMNDVIIYLKETVEAKDYEIARLEDMKRDQISKQNTTTEKVTSDDREEISRLNDELEKCRAENILMKIQMDNEKRVELELMEANKKITRMQRELQEKTARINSEEMHERELVVQLTKKIRNELNAENEAERKKAERIAQIQNSAEVKMSQEVIATMEETIENERTEVMRMKQQLADKDEVIDKRDTHIKFQESVIDRLQKHIERSSNQSEKALMDSKRRIEEMEKKRATAMSQHSKVLNQLKHENDELKKQNRELTEKIDTLQQYLLEEKRLRQQTVDAHSNQNKKLQELKDFFAIIMSKDEDEAYINALIAENRMGIFASISLLLHQIPITLPFRAEFNGFGVGAKVKLIGTPYKGDKSGFEIYMMESGEDVALMATISFDSEQRSAIDVKSRFNGKWSPTVRHIGVGLAIDRQFTLEITVNSGEFVRGSQNPDLYSDVVHVHLTTKNHQLTQSCDSVARNAGLLQLTVDGFKVTEFTKRCDDVKTLLVVGALVIDELIMTPSLLYYTPPPDYSDVVKEQVDVTALLNKIQHLPGAPELTPSDSLYRKHRLDAGHNQGIGNLQPIYVGGGAQMACRIPMQDDDDFRIGAPSVSGFSTQRLAPPRPPPPLSIINGSLSPSSDSTPAYDEQPALPRKAPLDQAHLPPTPAGCLRPPSSVASQRLNDYDPAQFKSAQSNPTKVLKSTNLYPKLDCLNDSNNENDVSTTMQNDFEHPRGMKSAALLSSTSSNSSRTTTNSCDNMEQVDQFAVNSSKRMGQHSNPNRYDSDFDGRRQCPHFATARVRSHDSPNAYGYSDITKSNRYPQPPCDNRNAESPISSDAIHSPSPMNNSNQRQRRMSDDSCPNKNSASSDTQAHKPIMRNYSSNLPPNGNCYRVKSSTSRPTRPSSTVNIYTPLFTTQQLQNKVGAFGKSATSFLKFTFNKGAPTKKQLIRMSLSERQQLTITATPVAKAKKFDIGLMHCSDYVLLFSARFDHFYIVLNSTRAGNWQEEEKVHQFPFRRELSFALRVTAANPLQIFVNDKFICNYELRCGLPVDAIRIDNNLRLEKFSIE
ncbi:unnamed protein product [Anisakis simplex]|uniref:Galectin domain-containing protein n=1 Tax=Anisakis simplex TaxID=6269 RepID=A0A0M3JXU4_ANISI|nr:unnamed protein product [Anisakis simplex]